MAITDNIRSYWKADVDGTFLDELSNNDMTIDGATFTTSGQINGAYVFDGTNDFCYSNDDDSASTKMTLSVWVKGVFGQYDAIICKYNTGASWYLGGDFSNGKKADFRVNTSSGDVNVLSNAALNDSAWHHIVAVYDNSLGSANVIMYVDNTLQTDTADETNSISASGELIAIGDQVNSLGSPSPSGYFDGTIDEVGFWTRALSSSEVSTLWNSGSGLGYPFSSGTNLQLNIGDAWKTVDAMQINIGDAWKSVAGAQINIGDAWKTIF